MCKIIEEYRIECVKEGEKHGEEREKKETVLRLLRAGHTIELASLASGMSIEDVLSIQHKLLN